jgi:HicB family
MADKTSDAIKLNLRLPKHLHKRLKQQARRNNVSLNTEIVNQLEGHEASSVARMAEWLKPALDNAIKEAMEMALYRTTRQSRDRVEALLDIVTRPDPARGRPDPIRTEAELAERFRQMGFPDSDVVYFLQIFRERQKPNQK